MKGPRDFLAPLSSQQLEQLAELEERVESWFANPKHRLMQVPADAFSREVLDELVRRAVKAGWETRRTDAEVVIQFPGE
jgi:hypothetical protein